MNPLFLLTLSKICISISSSNVKKMITELILDLLLLKARTKGMFETLNHCHSNMLWREEDDSMFPNNGRLVVTNVLSLTDTGWKCWSMKAICKSTVSCWATLGDTPLDMFKDSIAVLPIKLSQAARTFFQFNHILISAVDTWICSNVVSIWRRIYNIFNRVGVHFSSMVHGSSGCLACWMCNWATRRNRALKDDREWCNTIH